MLADALAWLAATRPAELIDVGTLTDSGAVGHRVLGMLVDVDTLGRSLVAAGERSGDPGWRLPLHETYAALLSSRVADLANAPADAPDTGVVAATYLRAFVGDVPWAHIDNGSGAWLERDAGAWPEVRPERRCGRSSSSLSPSTRASGCAIQYTKHATGLTRGIALTMSFDTEFAARTPRTQRPLRAREAQHPRRRGQHRATAAQRVEARTPVHGGGHGFAHSRRRRQRVHRLPARAGPDDPRPPASRGHPAVTDAISDYGTCFGLPYELEIEAAEKVVAAVPGIEQVRFTNSGSEAVGTAVRLARATTGRRIIVRFEGHYHGWQDTVYWSNHVDPALAGLPSTRVRSRWAPACPPSSRTPWSC